MRDSREHSPQGLPSSESQAIRFPRLRFQEAEPTSHEGKGRETASAEGGEATRRPAAAAHTPAHAFQSQAGARSCPGCCWPSVGQRGVRMEAGGGRWFPALLQGCPLSQAQLCGHWDFHTTLPGSKILFGPRQGGNAERQEDRLQREPRPDCATCTDVSGPWKPIFLHPPNWAVMSPQPSSPSCCSVCLALSSP